MCALPKFSFIVPNFGMRKGEMGNILAANAHALLHFGWGHWLPNEERRGSRTTSEGRRHGRTWKERAKKIVVDTANYKERYIASFAPPQREIYFQQKASANSFTPRFPRSRGWWTKIYFAR